MFRIYEVMESRHQRLIGHDASLPDAIDALYALAAHRGMDVIAVAADRDFPGCVDFFAARGTQSLLAHIETE